MRVLLVGVSCVGKTTIGALLAGRLGVEFFDLDEEIERHFGTSIERLQARFLTDYSYRKETSVVLRRLLADNADCVIALVPSGLRDAYKRVIAKVPCTVVAIADTPDNILKRIRFFDVDSKPIERLLTEAERKAYRNEIKKDITFFSKSYRAAHVHVCIAGLDADGSVTKIAQTLDVGVEERDAV